MINQFLLEWIPWIFNQSIKVIDISKRVVLAAYTEATLEKELLFLHSVQIPVSSMVFPNIPSEQILWRVKLNPTRFMNSLKSTEFNHISYLGMSVSLSGQTIDLTEWINEVKWSGNIAPTAKELFIIWCHETGSQYLHLMPIAEVEIINEDGDTIKMFL